MWRRVAGARHAERLQGPAALALGRPAGDLGVASERGLTGFGNDITPREQQALVVGNHGGFGGGGSSLAAGFA